MMKKCIALFLIFLLPALVWADPRMETTDNFCHFIHNTINSDDESFLADCGSQISVSDTKRVAQGFAYIERHRLPVGFDEVTTLFEKGNKTEIVITGEDFPGLACTLVDSNGTEYKTERWVNRIFFKAKKGKRFGKAVYQLHCIDAKVAPVE